MIRTGWVFIVAGVLGVFVSVFEWVFRVPVSGAWVLGLCAAVLGFALVEYGKKREEGERE